MGGGIYGADMRKSIVSFGLIVAAISGAARGQEALAPGAPADAVRAWQDLRFGMFIHWGPVSLTGHEIGWSRGRETPIEEYDALYKRFNPTNYVAAEWVAAARAAGMRYVVFTTKHHDGFCMWDTKQTDYNIMRSPFGRDVVKELAAACRDGGIRFGTYYSTCDWWHKDFPLGSPGGKTKKEGADLDAYVRYLRAQVTELVKGYGPLVTLWFDVPQVVGPEHGIETIRMLRALQPDIVINNRAYSRGPGPPVGDFETPEQRIGTFNNERPWETCMTICHQWAWKPEDKMKTLEECLHALVRTAGGDGNFLFNVGPMPDGRIEERQVDRLKEMGDWLTPRGESLYATRGGPYKPGPWGASTRKGSRIFLHVLKWPGSGDLLLPALPVAVKSASLLGAQDGGPVEVKAASDGLRVAVPAGRRDPIDTVVVLETDGDAMGIAPIATTEPSLSQGAKARASGIYKQDWHFRAESAVDGDENTRWATDAGTKTAWIELDLGEEKEFSRVRFLEWKGDPGRIRRFEIRVPDGKGWRAIASGDSLAKEIRFDKVRAAKVRIEILEAREGPTISEIEILK